MLELAFSRDGIECRLIESGIPSDKSIFIWIGGKQQLFDSLIVSYPPLSPSSTPSATVLMDYTAASGIPDLEGSSDGWGKQMAKRLSAKLKRPILLSLQPPADDGVGLEMTQRLRNVEKEIISRLLVPVK
jgi:hypothetical protein